MKICKLGGYMKKIKLIISVIIILLLLAVSTVGMFALPANNVDDRKANVAIVNEDNGMHINGSDMLYGESFTKLFSRNTDGKYEVTSRSAALDGLNNGKYDLAVIVPSNFTEKAMTYDSKEPEPAFLEYIKSPTSTQVESLKSEVVSKVLKETANKTLVETFTFEILKTMQDMQGKSLNIIENETKYQTNFKDNVETPVAESMTTFNQLLAELASQQTALSHFDGTVNTFNTALQSQNEAEKKHQADFEELKKRHAETKAALEQTSDSYNATLKLMNDDAYRKTLTDAQTAGIMSIQSLIDNVKLNTVKLELQIKKMEEYKTEMEKLKAAYDEVASSGVVTERNETDGVNDTEDVILNKKLRALASRVKTLSDPEGGLSIALNQVTKLAPTEAKKAFEAEFGKACAILPVNLGVLPEGYSQERLNAVKEFCSKANLKVDTAVVPKTKVMYTQTKTEDWSGVYTKLKTSNYANITVTYVRHNQQDGSNSAPQSISPNTTNTIIEPKGAENTITFTAVYKLEKEYSTEETIKLDFKPTDVVKGTLLGDTKSPSMEITFDSITPTLYGEDGNPLIGGLRPKQKEAIESIQQIEALSQVYYGKMPKQLIADYDADESKASVLPSDIGITGAVGGIQKFRPFALITPTGETVTDGSGNSVPSAWNGSLIARIEKVFDYNTLKIEVTKAFASELSTNTNDVISQMNGYIEALKERTDGALDMSKLPNGIYTDDTKTQLVTPDVSYYLDRDVSLVRPGSYNEVIANMKQQQDQLTEMSSNLTAFDTNFKTWLENYNKIPAEISKVTELRANEGKIVLQLDENQKKLLEGVTDLQKQVDGQLKETEQIMTAADKLKNDADASKAKIEQYTAKLQDTKKKFDDTVKDNGNFVNSFVEKYTSAQNGGADNQLFYQNYAKPVELNGKDVYNANSLVAFFIILLITIFSLVIAYFYNQWRIRRVAKSEHEDVSMFAGLATQLSLVALTALAAAGIIGYIGMQALDVKDVNMLKWFALIAGIAVAFTITFYMLLLRFKTYGMLTIGLMMLLYFITNGALGLNIMKNSTFSWLQWINPLIYFEKPLQGVIFQQYVNLLPIMTVLLLATIGSIIVIYVLQPLVHKQEMKEAN